jgi:hypothetical protein
MSDLTPQQQGRAYEAAMAKKIGGREVPMSGAGFTKLDVFGFKILFSLKHTIKKSFRVDDDLFTEARAAILSPGGVGPEYLPAVAVKTINHEIAAMALDDYMMLVHRLEELTKENEALRSIAKGSGLSDTTIDNVVTTAVSAPSGGYGVGSTRSLPSRKLPTGRPFRR